MRKTHPRSHSMIPSLLMVLTLIILAGCSGETTPSTDTMADSLYCLTSSYSGSDYLYTFYLTDSEGYSVSTPGTYYALYTVTVTDGTSHSWESVVTVDGGGYVSDVIMYANGNQEARYVLVADEYGFLLYTAAGTTVTEAGEYTALLSIEVSNESLGDVVITDKILSTVTVSEEGTVTGISMESDDTGDNKYVFDATIYGFEDDYDDYEDDFEYNFTDLDGNAVTGYGTYIVTLNMEYSWEDYSGTNIHIDCHITAYAAIDEYSIGAAIFPF